ncbi:transcription termination/antitermination NusG family protein [Bacillus mexicanus]|uniref:transcription termination/antitermination NusG family protein n=1 Tax=Bacillus mexicanus TaxID=2834415 RepID=UPI003D1E7A67
MTNLNDDLKYKSGWFACKVTSGHEMKVVNELKKLTKHPKWSQYIFDAFVPTEKVIDKKGKDKIKVLIKENIYVKMILTQEVYGIIQIEGFRRPLPPKDPTPVPEEQMQALFKYKND